MYQRFYEDTIMSRFIKHLLRSSNIPNLRAISNKSYLIEGCCYITDKYVIRCISSGLFYIDSSDKLYPSDNIYPSKIIMPDCGYVIAKYQVLRYYNESDPLIHYNYHSKNLSYDSDTHYYLGEYLRFLKAFKGINLLPYYNCYNASQLFGFELNNDQLDNSDLNTIIRPGYNIVSNLSYKLVSIPVKFSQQYTIAIDCNSPYLLRCMVYDQEVGLVKDPEGSSYVYLSDYFANTLRFKASSNFNDPYIIKIPDAANRLLATNEKNLYLVIQLPISNNSTITVLEGDYRYTWKSVTSNFANSDIFKNDHAYNLSLLQMNTHQSYAFSDRLIEYLLDNVIKYDEEFSGNIKYIQDLISNNYPDYRNRFYTKLSLHGAWDNSIRARVLSTIKAESAYSVLIDQDGYINKDIELIFNEGVHK